MKKIILPLLLLCSISLPVLAQKKVPVRYSSKTMLQKALNKNKTTGDTTLSSLSRTILNYDKDGNYTRYLYLSWNSIHLNWDSTSLAFAAYNSASQMTSFKTNYWDSKTLKMYASTMYIWDYNSYSQLNTQSYYANPDSLKAGRLIFQVTYDHSGNTDTGTYRNYVAGNPSAASSRTIYNRDASGRDTLQLSQNKKPNYWDSSSKLTTYYLGSTVAGHNYYNFTGNTSTLTGKDTAHYNTEAELLHYKYYLWSGKDSLNSSEDFTYFHNAWNLDTFNIEIAWNSALNYDVYTYTYSTYVITTHKISGTVKQSTGSALQNTWIYLLNFNTTDSTLHVSDSMKTDATGKYSFLTNDSLLYVYADPDSASYPHEIPTYYDSTVVFPSSTSVVMNMDRTIDFSTISGANPGGSGSVSGKVSFCTLCKKGGSAAFIKIILADSNNIPQAYTYTDKSGKFFFGKLSIKTYKVWVDKPGMKNSLAPSVSLNAKDPKIANLSFILYPDHLTEEITNGIKTENNPESLIKLYPQPAYERLYINSPVNSTIHWSVSDLFGRVLIYSSTRTEFINISGFAAGMYLFRYTDRNGNTGTIKFIKE